MRYICPKCKNTYDSDKKLEFCICGGKLEPTLSGFGEAFDLNALCDVFGDLFKKPKTGNND